MDHLFMQKIQQKVSKFRLRGFIELSTGDIHEVFGEGPELLGPLFRKVYDIDITKTSSSVPHIEEMPVPEVPAEGLPEPETVAP